MFCISKYSEGISMKLHLHYKTKYRSQNRSFLSSLYIQDYSMFCISKYSYCKPQLPVQLQLPNPNPCTYIVMMPEFYLRKYKRYRNPVYITALRNSSILRPIIGFVVQV